MNPLRFTLAKVSLIKLGCPPTLQTEICNRMPGLPIVAMANKDKLGITASGYCPAAVIVAGELTKERLMFAGHVRSWAYVQNGAIEITAEDIFSIPDLMKSMYASVMQEFYGDREPLKSQPWPSITACYPLDNSLRFEMNGKNYGHAYQLNPVEKKIQLLGKAMLLDKTIGATQDTMPRVQTGVRYAYAPTKGMAQASTRGALNSELMTCVIRNWSNIQEAADMYVKATKTGLYKPLRPLFAPVPLSDAGKIIGALAAKGIDTFDFARWSIKAQKSLNGLKTASKHKIGDMKSQIPGRIPSDAAANM